MTITMSSKFQRIYLDHYLHQTLKNLKNQVEIHWKNKVLTDVFLKQKIFCFTQSIFSKVLYYFNSLFTIFHLNFIKNIISIVHYDIQMDSFF